RPIASLPKGAAALVGMVEILYVLAASGLEDLGHAVFVFRSRQKMDVIRHPHIGVNPQAMLVCRIDQGIAKESVVRFGSKNLLAIVPSLDHVLWLVGDDVARKAGHVRERARRRWEGRRVGRAG